MAKIKVVRTYEVEVNQEELDKVRALAGNPDEVLIAASRCHDVGNLRGTIAMVYYYDEDAQMGSYEYVDDWDTFDTVVATVDYSVTEADVVIA